MRISKQRFAPLFLAFSLMLSASVTAEARCSPFAPPPIGPQVVTAKTMPAVRADRVTEQDRILFGRQHPRPPAIGTVPRRTNLTSEQQQGIRARGAAERAKYKQGRPVDLVRGRAPTTSQRIRAEMLAKEQPCR